MEQRMVVHYALHNQDPYVAAEALRVEQSIESQTNSHPNGFNKKLLDRSSQLPPTKRVQGKSRLPTRSVLLEVRFPSCSTFSGEMPP